MDKLEALGLLGLSGNFTEDDLKRAYRAAAKRHHPDRGGTEKEFKAVKEAYDKLLTLVSNHISGGFTHEAILIIRRR